MSECSQKLREQGKPYPRTCAVHGLHCPPTDRPWPPEGTRVRMRDGSEASGEEGILVRHDEVRLVEAEDGAIWYVLSAHEIEVIDE